jgi:hypothetical protein
MARTANLTRALVVTAKIRGIKARILINFGCLGNFVFLDFVKKTQFHTQIKGYQYTFYGIDN